MELSFEAIFDVFTMSHQKDKPTALAIRLSLPIEGVDISRLVRCSGQFVKLTLDHGFHEDDSGPVQFYPLLSTLRIKARNDDTPLIVLQFDTLKDDTLAAQLSRLAGRDGLDVTLELSQRSFDDLADGDANVSDGTMAIARKLMRDAEAAGMTVTLGARV